MFTGLISDIGQVSACEQGAEGARIAIATRLAGQMREGDSIAVDGVCLTATQVGDGGFRAQAMKETLRRCSLSTLRSGSKVNLELPLRLGDRLGGHIVQGHVDGMGTLAAIVDDGFAKVLRVQADPDLTRHLVQKGSVALSGVSLTVSALTEDGFEVSLIPETLQRTTLGALRSGERLNIEVDVLAKHVERLLGSRLTGR